MAIKLGIPKETVDDETRVAITPDLLKRFSRLGIEIVAESGAGLQAGFDDEAYRTAGATVVDSAQDIWAGCDIVTTLHPPATDQIGQMKEDAILLGLLFPMANPDVVTACVDKKVTAMSFDFVPRISRAQAVDALSAMGNLAGYKAALMAADHLPKILPMMMTAAGTVNAGKVFIIGAGVAGLQAIATAKRLGAIVEAYDVRPAVKEQIESLGARFIEFQIETKEGEGGYAAEQSEDEQRQQREQMKAVVIGADAVITTAAIPGREAPKLIDDDMVKGMRRGSVIVDLAAATGGNCTMTKPGEIYDADGVKIIGLTNLPALLPTNASQMYARIIETLLKTVVSEGALNLDYEDEIIDGMTVVHNGEIRAERVRESLTATASS